MPEIIAAAGIAQLKKTNYFLNKRVSIGNGYKQIAKNTELGANLAPKTAKWAPKMEQHAAYGNLTEFAERTQLSLEPLPPTAVRVIRGYAEPFLRRLVMGAFQRASDQQKTGIKIAEVVAETRPLQRVLKYSFVSPHGLIRYAQNDNGGGERLQHSPDDKSEEVLSEEKALLKQQKAKLSELKKQKAQKAAEKAEIRAEKKERAAAALAAAAGTA